MILRNICLFYNDFIGQILESFPSSFSPKRLISRICPFSNKLCQRWVNQKHRKYNENLPQPDCTRKRVKMWLKLKLQDPSSFMYCIIVNIRLHSLTEETKWCILLISIAVALYHATTIINGIFYSSLNIISNTWIFRVLALLQQLRGSIISGLG